jgi:hypothetical protein
MDLNTDQLLKQTKKLSDNTHQKIFYQFEANGANFFNCALCRKWNISSEKFLGHVKSPIHQGLVKSKQVPDAQQFREFLKRTKTCLEKIKLLEIYKKNSFSAHTPDVQKEFSLAEKTSTLFVDKEIFYIGIEYVFELCDEKVNKKLFFCALCGTTFNGETISIHLLSYGHSMKYVVSNISNNKI